LIFLLLTPAKDDRIQLDLLSDIAESCLNVEVYEDLVRAASYTEFRAGLMVASHQMH
jgi:mannitol/fructose-specific phosphotransferase system IIA component (Ntr-type)